MSQYWKHFTAVGDEQHTTPQLPDEEEPETCEGLVVVFPSQLQDSPNYQNYLRSLFSRDRFQICVVCLVILDAAFVLLEVLMNLSIISPGHWHITPKVFHFLSLGLLSLFILELLGKLYAYRIQFLKHSFELLDGTVVIMSFVLEIVYMDAKDIFTAVGLLILLRLWRVARIIKGKDFSFLESRS